MPNIVVKDDNNKLFIKLKNKFTKPLTNLQLLVVFFFIYSIIGWFLESLYCIYTLGYFEKRGFLYGPLCPIYGFGALISLIMLQPFNKNKFILFIYSMLVFTIFEYLVSYGLDALFSMKFWDYSNNWFNINGRVALWFSVVWGIFGILFIHFIHPTIRKFIDWGFKKIHGSIQHIIIALISSIYVIDTLASTIKYII